MPVIEPSLWKYLDQTTASGRQGVSSGYFSTLTKSGFVSADEEKREVKIRVKDLQKRPGVSLTLADDRVGPDDTLIRGYFFNRELRDGLKLSCSNTREECAFTSSSAHEAGLSCMFFLEGEVDVRIGKHQFDFAAGRSRGGIRAAAALKQCSLPFKRVTKFPQNVRHLVVTASPDWLAKSGFEYFLEQNLDYRLRQQSIVTRQWTPSPRLERVIQEIFSPTELVPELLDLYLEARSIDIVSETLMAMIQSDESFSALDRHSQVRLRKAKELILQNSGEALCVDRIARYAGMSASGLQRLFHRAESCSVFDYVRQVRLDNALNLLKQGQSSVQEVSEMAGYKNPANFATAFKRRFGITPRQASATSAC